MATYIADIDLIGSETERPYLRYYVSADSADGAMMAAADLLAADEKVRGVRLLQPILDEITACKRAGVRYSISWKDEGKVGPVVITNLDEAESDSDPLGIPYESEHPYQTYLPWMTRAEARRLAAYLGLTLEEW